MKRKILLEVNETESGTFSAQVLDATEITGCGINITLVCKTDNHRTPLLAVDAAVVLLKAYEEAKND